MNDGVQLTTSTIVASFNATTSNPIITPSRIIVGRYVGIFLTIASSYVFSSLLVYSIRSWRVDFISKVNHLPVVSAFFSVCLSSLKCLEQWIPLMPCSTIHWIETIVYIVGIVTTYTVLWARQRKLYADDLSAAYVGKPVRISSVVLLMFIYLGISLTSIFFRMRYYFVRNSYPCIVEWRQDDLLYAVPGTFMTVCFLFQFVLFFLILYPLRRKSTGISRRFSLSLQADTERTARRLAVCLCACITSSTMLCALIMADATQAIHVHWCNFAALDLLINTIASTCATVNWSQRLFSFCVHNKTSCGQTQFDNA